MILVYDEKIEVVPKRRPTPFLKNGKMMQVPDKKTNKCMKNLAESYEWFMLLGKQKPFEKKTLLKINFNIWVERSYRQGSNDIDNFYKCFTDAGNKILYQDDSQIVKFYGDCNVFFSSELNRLTFTISELTLEEKQERGILI